MLEYIITKISASPRAAAVISTGTAGAGTGTLFDWFTTDFAKLIGLFGAFAGLILSIILIRLYLAQLKKTNLEIEIKKRELMAKAEKDVE